MTPRPDDDLRSTAVIGLLAADDAPVPEGLTDRMVAAVRRVVEDDRGWAEVTPDVGAGSVRVRTEVLAGTARLAAGEWPGVDVVAATAERTDEGLVLALVLVVDGSAPLPRLARDLRRHVRRALGAAGLGDAVDRVDLHVADLA